MDGNTVCDEFSDRAKIAKTLIKSKNTKEAKSKLKYLSKNIDLIGKPNFWTLDIKKTFNHFKQIFIKAPIL